MNSFVKEGRMPFQAIFSDLDDTLFDTSGTLIPQAIQDTFEVLIEAGLGAKMDDLKQILKNHPRVAGEIIFEIVLSKFSVRRSSVSKSKTELLSLARDVYYNRPIPRELMPFDKVKTWLKNCREGKIPVYLISAGEKYTQEKKIEALGVSKEFKSIIIVDARTRSPKAPAMEQLLKVNAFEAKKVLCLGNRLDDEIRAGLELGLTVCWINRGEKGENTTLLPHYGVESFEEFYKAWPNMQPRSS